MTVDFLLGVDKANVFDAGIVYEAVKILDEIILRPVGKYALSKEGNYPNENSASDEIMYSGLHLMTKEELEQIRENENKRK